MEFDHRRALDGPDITAMLIRGNQCGWSADFQMELAEQHARSGHIDGHWILLKNAERKRRQER